MSPISRTLFTIPTAHCSLVSEPYDYYNEKDETFLDLRKQLHYLDAKDKVKFWYYPEVERLYKKYVVEDNIRNPLERVDEVLNLWYSINLGNFKSILINELKENNRLSSLHLSFIDEALKLDESMWNHTNLEKVDINKLSIVRMLSQLLMQPSGQFATTEEKNKLIKKYDYRNTNDIDGVIYAFYKIPHLCTMILHILKGMYGK